MDDNTLATAIEAAREWRRIIDAHENEGASLDGEHEQAAKMADALLALAGSAFELVNVVQDPVVFFTPDAVRFHFDNDPEFLGDLTDDDLIAGAEEMLNGHRSKFWEMLDPWWSDILMYAEEAKTKRETNHER